MTTDEIRTLLEAGLDGCEVHVDEPVPGKFSVTVIGEAFVGLSRVRREQKAGAPLRDAILDGRLHAVSYRTYTPDEWAERGA
ncbi:MAG: BolA/IbaG family iron-sulfur metabolism protein [Gammaproteobacteria bacterium]|nr:MAG: BolA/IbaG family iron-sulfur metabolism protein [Gammaproteobacteria bacterium]